MSDMQLWIDVLADRDESLLLKKAQAEFQVALSLLSIGSYRYAFVALRSCLELALTGVQHSAHALWHSQWKAGRRDIVWASLSDDSDGVLSPTYAKEFAPGLESETRHVAAIAKSAYRQCSEFVHGNLAVDELVSNVYVFSQNSFKRWHEVAENVQFVIVFALAMRFLSRLDSTQLAVLEQCLIERLGHLTVVREFLSQTPGVS
ncbi:MAG: hypothetical protein KIT84_01120 [Labilithrix sp.]|nr:hypothetical protein [Labilithrix sp.]MCW5809586.1 hypothetical protein [Labilithrix sp.]